MKVENFNNPSIFWLPMIKIWANWGHFFCMCQNHVLKVGKKAAENKKGNIARDCGKSHHLSIFPSHQTI
jgi:hypothetical protein